MFEYSREGPRILRRSVGRKRYAALACVAWFWSVANLWAEPVDGNMVLKATPAESIFVYASVPAEKDATQPSSLTSLKMLVDGAHGLGLLAGVDAEVRCWLDTLNGYADVLNYPHAFSLLDIKARARADGGHELAGMNLALIIHTGGQDEILNKRVQHLLSTYTNSTQTTLQCSTQDDGSRCTLTDRRIPDWFIVEWGAKNGYYIATIGQGTFERVLGVLESGKGLAEDGWFVAALRETAIPRPSSISYLNMTAARPAIDSSLQGKVDRVLAVLGWDHVDRAILATGSSGRFSLVEGVARRDGRNERFSLINPKFLHEAEDKVIPKQASRVAVINCHPQGFVNSICDGYLAARSVRARERIKTFWARVQADSQVSIESDILGLLDHGVIVHDFPRHALGLPFARTVVFRIKENPERLRENIDKLLTYAKSQQAWLAPLSLQRDEDGVWSLNLGFSGPALAVTNDRVILSFSPQAVRQVLIEAH